MKWNADVLTGGRKDLVDYYTQEEIKVEFILDCLFAESRNQRSSEACDIMAKSVLEFISKISGRSDLYTTPVFWGRLGWIQSQATAFNEFIWAFGIEDTRTACQWHEMCYFKAFSQEQWGYHCQRQEIISRGSLPS